MKISVEHLIPGQEALWNLLVNKSDDGTIFHRLDFLAYHGDRFKSFEHHLILINGTTPFGVMPMAIFEGEHGKIAKSPYGASYGGPVVDRILTYSESMALVRAVVDYLCSVGVKKICIVLPPRCCSARYSDTFRLALLEHGFVCTNRDISSVVDLRPEGDLERQMDSRGRNMARKARNNLGVEIRQRAAWEDFWSVLHKTHDKLGVPTSHSLSELVWLGDHLSGQVFADVAYLGRQPVAGVCYFVINHRVNSSFYLCQDSAYRQSQALSLLVYEGLISSRERGFRWFDFGTSSANQQGRENLFRFKESFGAVGQFRETYSRRLQ